MRGCQGEEKDEVKNDSLSSESFPGSSKSRAGNIKSKNKIYSSQALTLGGLKGFSHMVSN